MLALTCCINELVILQWYKYKTHRQQRPGSAGQYMTCRSLYVSHRHGHKTIFFTKFYSQSQITGCFRKSRNMNNSKRSAWPHKKQERSEHAGSALSLAEAASMRSVPIGSTTKREGAMWTQALTQMQITPHEHPDPCLQESPSKTTTCSHNMLSFFPNQISWCQRQEQQCETDEHKLDTNERSTAWE